MGGPATRRRGTISSVRLAITRRSTAPPPQGHRRIATPPPASRRPSPGWPVGTRHRVRGARRWPYAPSSRSRASAGTRWPWRWAESITASSAACSGCCARTTKPRRRRDKVRISPSVCGNELFLTPLLAHPADRSRLWWWRRAPSSFREPPRESFWKEKTQSAISRSPGSGLYIWPGPVVGKNLGQATSNKQQAPASQ